MTFSHPRLRHPWGGLVLGALIVVFTFPLVWMVSYSLRSTGLPPPSRLELFIPPFAFQNYIRLGEVAPIGQFLLNSLKVIALATPLTILSGSWAGFAISQLRGKVQVGLVLLSLALLLVPAPAHWIPRFILYSRLGWIDTITPLLAPSLMGYSPFYVLMFFVSFSRISREIYESARLDGAGVFQTWRYIALPVARPTVVAIALLVMTDYWSNVVDPLLYLRSEGNYTLPVGIRLLELSLRANWPLLMAASVIMVAPVVIIFILAQRYFLDRPGPGIRSLW